MIKQELIDRIQEYLEEKGVKKFIPGKSYIPPSSPCIFPEDIAFLVRVALDGWFTEWKVAERFKGELGKLFPSPSWVTLCNSGSSANLLALNALSDVWGERKESKYIITCATAFPTTVSSIYHVGKLPFYIDIDPLRMTPSIDQLHEVLYKHGDFVQGSILTHVLGFPFDEREVGRLSELYQIFFISDCCDALGARIGNFHVGSFSHVATLSFFPAHHITTGEGGAVVSFYPDLYRIVESLNNWGRSCWCKPGQQNTCGQRFSYPERGDMPEHYDHKYIYDRPGYNFKMTELQAALGVAQIGHLNDFVEQRKRNFLFLKNGLSNYQDFLRIPEAISESEFSPFGFPILVEDHSPFVPDDLISWLEGHKIGTRRIFAGNIVRQPGFARREYKSLSLEGSDRVMRNMFWISCGAFLNKKMLDYIVTVIAEFMEKFY